jgi:hypothetical protein
MTWGNAFVARSWAQRTSPKRAARRLHPAAEVLVAAVMLRRFHRGRAVAAVSRSGGAGRRAVVCFRALQWLTFMLLGFPSFGRLFLFGVDGVVAWWLLPDGACRARGGTACTPGILTAA